MKPFFELWRKLCSISFKMTVLLCSCSGLGDTSLFQPPLLTTSLGKKELYP